MEQVAKPNVVGPEIRRRRYALHLTQEMLAARCTVLGCELTRGTLSKIEAQIRGITDLELPAISKVLKVSMEELFPKAIRMKLLKKA
jgi:transcriptional regulator with XRE-family HTH domain